MSFHLLLSHLTRTCHHCKLPRAILRALEWVVVGPYCTRSCDHNAGTTYTKNRSSFYFSFSCVLWHHLFISHFCVSPFLGTLEDRTKEGVIFFFSPLKIPESSKFLLELIAHGRKKKGPCVIAAENMHPQLFSTEKTPLNLLYKSSFLAIWEGWSPLFLKPRCLCLFNPVALLQ